MKHIYFATMTTTVPVTWPDVEKFATTLSRRSFRKYGAYAGITHLLHLVAGHARDHARVTVAKQPPGYYRAAVFWMAESGLRFARHQHFARTCCRAWPAVCGGKCCCGGDGSTAHCLCSPDESVCPQTLARFHRALKLSNKHEEATHTYLGLCYEDNCRFLYVTRWRDGAFDILW